MKMKPGWQPSASQEKRFTLHCTIFNSVGNEPQFQMTWSDVPNEYEKGNTAYAICIDVYLKDSEDNYFELLFISHVLKN